MSIDELPGPGTPWQLHREGSQLWFSYDGKRYPATIEQLEAFANGALVMVRDARHWKRRGE